MIYCFAFSKFVEITRIISQDSWLFFEIEQTDKQSR